MRTMLEALSKSFREGGDCYGEIVKSVEPLNIKESNASYLPKDSRGRDKWKVVLDQGEEHGEAITSAYTKEEDGKKYIRHNAVNAEWVEYE